MASENSSTKKKNRDLLNEAGLRNTSQRQSILDIIRRGQGHLDADEIYQRARKKQPRLSLSTVYRTLQTLKELGLLEEVHLDETHHHYEIKASNEHHHLICLDCGKIVEFECSTCMQMKKEVGQKNDFEVVNIEMRMTGYCPKCRQKRETSDARN